MSESVDNKSKINVLVKIVLCFAVFLLVGFLALIFSASVEHLFISSMTDVHILFATVVGILAAKDIYKKY